jgi:cytoskeleton protein RodZ
METDAGGVHETITSVGSRLQEARIARDLSLEQIAAQTRVPLRHLSAIERGDFANMPAAPYAVGFVKSFARVAGLDPQETGNAFRAELAVADADRPMAMAFEPADPTRIPPRWLAIAALVIALLVVGSYGVWRGVGFGGTNPVETARLAADLDTPAPAPSAKPSPIDRPAATPDAPPSALAATGTVVAVTAVEPVWVKLYDGGRTLFMGTLAAGQRFDIPADAADPMIWTGRPDMVRVTVGDRAIPPLGDPSRRIKDVSLKADALLARAAATPPPATPPAA